MASRKKLYSVKLEGTNSDGEDDFLYYDVYEPIEGVHDILNDKSLPKNEQKWVRPTFPIFENCSKYENEEIYKREIRRIKHGVYFWSNGKLIYVTGVHYAGMVHWKLMESKTDYFIYTRAQRDIFYFMDLCVNDPKCVGGIIFSLKRLGKSEIMQLEMFVDALLSEKGRYTFQGLNFVEAKKNFAKTFYANKHLHESLPVTKFDETKKSIKNRERDNLIVFSREELTNGIVWTAVDTKTSTDNIDFGVKPTNLSGIQGQKLKRASLDEFASLEKEGEMTLENWHSKAYAQTTEDSGSVVVGKIWLIATAENINSSSLAEAQQIWNDSAPNKIDLNGFTPSGLKRMFIPFYLGGRGDAFLDEFGEPRIEVAIKHWENKMAGLSDSGKTLYSHQNPRTIEHVFNIDKDGGLEIDCLEILTDHLKNLQKIKHSLPIQYCSIYMDNGELKKTQKKAETEDEQARWVEIIEDPKPNVTYVVGVDGTNTSKQTSENIKKKSKFAIVVKKLFESVDADNYLTVANYAVVPDKMEDLIKMVYYLTIMYNKYDRCTVMAEGNVGIGDALVSYFTQMGVLKLLRKQPKYFGTESKEVKNRHTVYVDEHVSKESLRLLNIWVRRHGRNEKSTRIIKDWLKVGTTNTDFASASRVALLGCGNFDPETIKKKVEKPRGKRRQQLTFVNGEWKYTYV